MTKFNCLIAFTSNDFEQYVYYNCLLTSLDVMNFEINLFLLIKSFSYMIKTSGEKLKYLGNKKSFDVK